MKKITIPFYLAVLCGAGFSTALAQEPNDDGGAATGGVAAASTLHSLEPVVERYLVTYLKSRTDALRSATVVTVTNQSNKSCDVKIDWFAGFTPDNRSLCWRSGPLSRNRG
ncbi:MAG: hypothetical protein ACRD8U_01105 [Pyrinomonadaceae bacterium]